ncbi:MAG: PspC domain-containing protein [Mucilaginibacter sp.]
MNKTIIININGFIFHIEEDAYEILKNYMTDVKRHFLNSADSLEITTDIENRIAEMFTEILAAQNKQVIVDQDVNMVIQQMGSVEDFESSEDEPKSTTYDSYDHNNINKRKLFRDSEDHLLGGVCSGLANYFDAQAIWIRLAFALAFAFFGTGLILYIILWIVIPKAVTRADRMAMKGEKLNLQGFKNNLEEEMSTVRGHLNDLHKEAQPMVYKVRDFFGNLFSQAGGLLIKLIGAAIILGCIGLIVFLVIALFVLVALGRHFAPFNDLPYDLLSHTYYTNLLYISAFLVGFIPAVSIILFTLKGIFNARSINRTAGSALLIIWLFAIGVFAFYCTKIAANFASSANFSETSSLSPSSNNVYYLELNQLKYLSAEDSVRLDVKSMKPNMQITDDPYEYNDFDHFQYRNVHVDIERSDNGKVEMIRSYRARGHNYDEALANARNIKYGFSQQDSVLKFDYRVYAKNDELWHDEELYITLKLPLNAKVVINNKVENMINNLNLWECRKASKQEHAQYSTFVITENGAECKIDPAIIQSRKNAKRMLDSLEDMDGNHDMSHRRQEMMDSLRQEIE